MTKMTMDIKPIITETTMGLAKKNWYTFGVPLGSGKNELRKLIEGVFEVKVIDIKTMVVKGKKKKSLKTRKMRKQSDWKKVMVRIKEGQKIDIFEGGA